MEIAHCLDFTIPIEDRLQNLKKLDSDHLDELLEIICSVYNITPFALCREYLSYLVLDESFQISRRIRVAEACEMYTLALYLLSRITDGYARIGYIEMFSNQYLKVHAYIVLYHKSDMDMRIQIMKNLWVYTSIKYRASYIQWFAEIMENSEMLYEHRSSSADFLLSQNTNSEAKNKALKFFNMPAVSDGRIFSEHKENVHLLLPKMDIILSIVEKNKKCPLENIVDFFQKHQYDLSFFRKRILSDKTNLSHGTDRTVTLEVLLVRIWGQLTDQLRHLLVQDLLNSKSKNVSESWSCTTGFYHRILNIYQLVYEESRIFETDDSVQFYSVLRDTINGYIMNDEKSDDILEDLTDQSNFRIKYLTFKAHSLSRILDNMREKFSDLDDDNFDFYFQKALTRYEDFMDFMM